MTNELEKMFFDTFDIKPKTIIEPRYSLNTEYYENKVETYPQITDHILLELICILSRHTTIGHCTIDGLKRQLLNLAIIHKKDILEQVRALFKEVGNYES